jgi:lipopolysaccharide export system permease protein
MKVITRQFTKEILSTTAFALVVLVALFAFFDFVGQLDNISGGRSVKDAFLLTGLTLPLRVYQVMPLAALLASVYTMSRWAASSEFTVLRVAGLSPWRLTLSMSLSAVVLVALTYWVGEYIASPAEKYSIELKTSSKSVQLKAKGYSSGVWLRDVYVDPASGKLNRFINVSYIVAKDDRKTGPWRVFEFDQEGSLRRMITAKAAQYDPANGWQLSQVKLNEYPTVAKGDPEKVASLRVKTQTVDTLVFKSTLGADILSVFTSRPDDMSMRDLSRFIEHLKANDQDTTKYDAAFWTKVFYPLGTLVMLMLSMPFAYMNVRSGGMAIKMFVGIIIGIVYYALSNIFSYLGVSTSLPAMWAALLPTLAMLIAGAIALYFVERR